MSKIFFLFALLFVSLNDVSAQKEIVVFDDKGNPVPYAGVSITCSDNSTKQAITTFNGVFTIDDGCVNPKLKIKHSTFQTKWVELKTGQKEIVLYPRDIQMNTLVVTGQYSPTSDVKSVNKVKVIDNKRILAQGAVNLQELMEQEMNIRVSQDQFLGSSMSIQGLSGENVKILIDGVPIIGRQNGNIDLSQINLSNIERVEIVEGPLSVSYGTNALAGTINLITKKNTENIAVNANAYYETIGQYNTDGNVNIGFKKHSLGLEIGRNYFDGYSQLDTSRVKEWKPKEQWFGGVRYQTTINKVDIALSSKLFNEKLTARGEPRSPYFETAFDDYYYTKRIDNSITINSKLGNYGLVNVLGGYNYYEREKRAFLKDLVTIEYTLLDNPALQDTSVFDLFFSRGTYSFAKDSSKLNFQLGYDINVETTRGKRIVDNTREIGDYALFGSVEYRPTTDLIIKPGIRYAYNTEYTSPIIPSLNVKYQATQHLSLRGSYGRGFRSPSLKELYFLFVDLNHNIQGNESLNAELSDNYMVQMAYKRGIKRGVYDFSLSGFYNKVNNQISLALIDAGEQLYTYTNIGQFYSQGINFNSGFRYKTYKTSFGFSYIGRYNLASETNTEIEKYSYSPEFTTSFIYEVEEWQTSLSLFYKYAGKLLGYSVSDFGDVSQFEISDYGMMDASVINFFWKKRISTTVGVKNIFNVQDIQSSQLQGGVHSGGSGSLPVSWGRTFFIKLALSINGK